MTGFDEALRQLDWLCQNPEAYDRLVSQRRYKDNFDLLLHQARKGPTDSAKKLEHQKRLRNLRQQIPAMPLCHRTCLEAVLSVLQQGALLSIDEMEKRDVSFNFRITYRGIIDELHKYIFCMPGTASSCYGPFELQIDPSVAKSPGTLLLPRSQVCYAGHELPDALAEAEGWQDYLAEHVASEYDGMEDFLKKTPVWERPELLIRDSIPASKITGVLCSSEQQYSQLVRRVTEEFGPSTEFLQLIKCVPSSSSAPPVADDMLHVVAVEIPFLISYLPAEPVPVIVRCGGDLFIKYPDGDMLLLGPTEPGLDLVLHLCREGRYEWTDFQVAAGSVITRDYDYNVLVDGHVVDVFGKLEQASGRVGAKSLYAFNVFLRAANSDNIKMVEALRLSLRDGFFRHEVEDIIKNDVVRELSNLDKEIIVRCKLEGIRFVRDYVERLLASNNYDKYIDINYFFRRLFNMEVYQYLQL